MKLLKLTCTVAAAMGFFSAPILQANDVAGAWGSVFNWPIIPIHSVLTPDGKIMTFGTNNGGGQGAELHYGVWDPALGTGPAAHSLLPNATPTDIFCAAQVLMPQTGQVLLSGGDNGGDGNWGNPDTTFFDSVSGTMTDGGFSMAYPRWYPTTTTLPNGEILVQGGSDDGVVGNGMLTPEVFNPLTGWRSLFGAASAFAYGDNFYRWWYPRSWVTPDGRVFGIAGPALYFLEYEGEGNLIEAGTFSGSNIGATSTAVMYAPGKILQTGGGHYVNGGGPLASSAASLIDVTGENPVVTAANPMHFPRHWANSTILPNGQVLVTGGSDENAGLGGAGPAFSAEIWDPETGQWTVLSQEVHARLYHSTAILLPDGTVVSAGGGAPGPVNNLNAQIFYPPYLYKGSSLASRPQINVPNKTVSYGGTLQMNLLASANPIERVTLVKTGAVTHSFNNDQRFIELDFSQSGQQINANVPDSANIATPGFYLVYALDTEGVPSVGQIVHLPPAVDFQNGNLVADGGFETLNPDAGGWINVGVGSGLGPWSVASGVVSIQDNNHGGLGMGGASGQNHLDLNGPPIGSVSQTINGLTSGQTYALTYDYAIHNFAGGSAGAHVSIADFNQSWTATNIGVDNWIQATHVFTATASSETLTFAGTAGNPCCGMLIDDVTIAPVSDADFPAPVVKAYPLSSGNQLNVSGVNQYGEIPHNDAMNLTQAFTLAARIKPNSFGDWQGIITKGIDNSPYAMQIWGNGALRLTSNWGVGGQSVTGTGHWNSTLTLTPNEWNHVAIVSNGHTIKFYINGQLDTYEPAATIAFGTNTQPLIIGADLPGGDEYFDGEIADVAVFNRHLSQSQIQQLADGHAAGAAPVVNLFSAANGAGPLTLNGSSEYHSVPASEALNIQNEITLTATVNADSFHDWDGVITKGVNNSPYALQLWGNGAVRFTANWGGPAGAVGGGSWNSSLLLQPGTTHHIAVTYDGFTVKFYVDGVLDSYQPAVSLMFGVNSEILTIGADLPGGDEYFDGQISNVKVYSRALSESEINAVF